MGETPYWDEGKKERGSSLTIYIRSLLKFPSSAGEEKLNLQDCISFKRVARRVEGRPSVEKPKTPS